MGTSGGERGEHLRPSVLIAMVYFNSRAVEAAKHRGRMCLARVRGRRRPGGQRCPFMAVIPGGMPPLRDNWAELPAWTFQCDFPP